MSEYGDVRAAPLLALGSAAMGVVCGAIAVADYWSAAAVFRSSAAFVPLPIGSAVAAPIAVMLVLFAALTVRRPSADGKREMRLFARALWCLPLAVALPIAAAIAGGAALSKAGYSRCTTSVGGRLYTQHWATSPGACPPSDRYGARG